MTLCDLHLVAEFCRALARPEGSDGQVCATRIQSKLAAKLEHSCGKNAGAVSRNALGTEGGKIQGFTGYSRRWIVNGSVRDSDDIPGFVTVLKYEWQMFSGPGLHMGVSENGGP